MLDPVEAFELLVAFQSRSINALTALTVVSRNSSDDSWWGANTMGVVEFCCVECIHVACCREWIFLVLLWDAKEEFWKLWNESLDEVKTNAWSKTRTIGVTLPRESELNQLQCVWERPCSPGETAVAETFFNDTKYFRYEKSDINSVFFWETRSYIILPCRSLNKCWRNKLQNIRSQCLSVQANAPA